MTQGLQGISAITKLLTFRVHYVVTKRRPQQCQASHTKETKATTMQHLIADSLLFPFHFQVHIAMLAALVQHTSVTSSDLVCQVALNL